MASGTASGDGRYRVDLSSGVSGTTINASISATKTGGTGFWTATAQWWRIRISSADQDGSWTYDFRGATPKTIGIATRSRAVGYGTFLVETWVNFDSGIGQAYAAEYVTITNPATVPATPSTPTVSDVTTSSMRLSWSIPSNGGAGIDQMLLRRFSMPDGSGGYVDYPNAGDATSRVVGDLTPGTVYYWAVYAHNGVGYSGRSGLIRKWTLSGAPVLAAPSTATPGRVDLTWSAVAGATDYIVSVSSRPDMLAGDAFDVAGTSLSTPPGLTPGETYYFRVAARNPSGVGPGSAIQSATVRSGARVPKAGVYVTASQVVAPKGGVFVGVQVKVPKAGAYVSAI